MNNERINNLLNSKIAQKAALIAAICAAILALGKLSLYFITGSLIVALSAWDSAIDMIVSLVNRKIVKFSRLDADSNHPYGHGRAESIAALGQGCLIIGGAIGIIASSFSRVYDHFSGHNMVKIYNDWKTLVFFLFAAFVSIFVTKMLKRNGEKLKSPALLADSEHYKVDFITNISSGFAIFLVLITDISILDPIIAFLFALYIIYGAFGLIKTSINELMDHDISEDVKIKILNRIKEIDFRIIDIHRFRGRKIGHKYFFDFHVTLPVSLSFSEVHEVIESIEEILSHEFDSDVIVHADPDSIKKNEIK